MRKILLLLILPLLLFASTKRLSIQLEWEHQFEFAGLYTAVEKGFYKDIGLDIEIKKFKDGIDIVDEVVKNRSTFGYSSSALILKKLQNQPVVLLASYFKQNTLALATKPNIKKLSDLKNKKIMALPYEIDNTSIGVMLKSANLKKGDYTLVKHDFSIDKFVNGEVDAMSIFTTNQPYLLDKKRVAYHILNPADYGIYSYDKELFTSKKFANQNPVLVQNFIQATNRGWKYAFEHKSEIVNLIYKKYSKKKSKDALMFEAREIEKLFKTDIFKIGSVVKELVEFNTILFKKLDLVDKNIDIKKALSDYIFKQEEHYSTLLHLTQAEKDFIKKHPIIRVGNDRNWPPFDFYENRQAKGFNIDYLKEISKISGLTFKFVQANSWNDLMDKFKNREIDILTALEATPSRKKIARFSDDILVTFESMITKKSYPSPNSYKDLYAKRVGIIKGYDTQKEIEKNYKEIDLVLFNSPLEALRALNNSEIDVFIENASVAKYLINRYFLSNLKLGNSPKFPNLEDGDKINIASRDDYPQLHSIIQKSIHSITDKFKKELHDKWMATIQNPNNSINLTLQEKKYLQEHKITMCIDPNWMPFEKFTKDGKHTGITSDYYKIFRRALHTDITPVRSKTWIETLTLAKERKCDIISLAVATPERKEYLNFTTSYLKIPIVIATKLDKPFVYDINNLKNKTVGITKGYAFVKLFRAKYKNLNIVEVENIEEGLMKVNKGELFGFIGTLASINYMFQHGLSGQLKIAGKLQEVWELGIAVRNDDKTLLNILQKAIDSITQHQRTEILNKWISIKYESKIDYTLAWQIFFIAIIILLAILFWLKTLSKLNKKLKIAKISADEANQQKANFLANMSHEIRTPMNSVIGMAYLLKETKLNQIQKDYVSQIENSSTNLLKLLNEILDFSKLEANKLSIKKANFNLLEVINHIENLLKLTLNEKALEFKITYDKSLSMNVYGDKLRLSQILINLLSNAVKFTNKGGIELVVTKLNQKRFSFEIIDTGIGLKSEDIQKIFSSFTQVDNSNSRKHDGTGLGLAIAKELVTLMKGDILVESTLDKGSKFSFEIELESIDKKLPSKTISIKKDIHPKGIKKNNLSDEDAKVLFDKLKVATAKRRPQLCQPILKEFEKYNLDEKNQKIFNDICHLIKSYKFDEAGELL